MRLDAEEHFVRNCVFLVKVMGVVRHDEGNTEFAAEFYHFVECDDLLVDTMVLQLKVKILFPENRPVLERDFLCQFALAVEKRAGNGTGNARR